MKYASDETPAFTDANLTPRARNLALWLCDLAHPALDRDSRDASADLLLRELPDHWTAGELEAEAGRIRQTIGPKQSRCAWLRAMGWLVGDEERLPARPSQRVTDATRFALKRAAHDLVRRFTARA